MDPASSQLDTRVRVVTPENIAFEYRIAGPFARIGAYLIDCLICVFVVIAAMIVMSIVFGLLGLSGLAFGLIQVLWFGLSWFYGGVFETFWNGQTPGKRLVGIRVLTVDGQPINGLQAVLRNILRTADWLPVFVLPAGLFAAAVTRRMQRLGDLASGTMVVAEDPRWFRELVEINDPEALALADRIPPDFQVGRSLARALAVYAQRRVHFSWPRRLEIARHLAAPLCERWRLPPGTNPDALLCALYRRTFGIEQGHWPTTAGSPFVAAPAGATPRTPQGNSSPAAAAVASAPGRGSPFAGAASPGGRL
jgi:uncharacterized RDD family membrane protein YckC